MYVVQHRYTTAIRSMKERLCRRQNKNDLDQLNTKIGPAYNGGKLYAALAARVLPTLRLSHL